MENITFETDTTYKLNFTEFNLRTQSFKKSQPSFNGFAGGVPLSYDDLNKTVYVDSSDTHTIVFGATGSLKSRAVVMPTVKILASAGESMIINDSKGEIYEKLSAELKNEHGYNLIVINLREPKLSNAWNPLKIPYEFYKNGFYDRAAEFCNDIANNLMLAEISVKDPYWDYSAADLCLGLTLLLFKYCKDNDQPIEAVNIGNIIKLRQLIFEDDSPQDNELWKYAQSDELITTSLSGSITAPTNTRQSILSVFDQKIRAFSIQPTLLDMLANDDLNLDALLKEKTAIFIITPDEKTLYHRLIALFIKQTYEYIIYCAQNKQDKTQNNRINFILDEFSTLPNIHDMPAMISAARSRNIRFLLVIQSLHQLKQRYEAEAETIISNCNNWIFFTSRELELLTTLSTLCGIKGNGQPLISVFDLQHFNKSRYEALVLAGRLKPKKVYLLDIDKYLKNKSNPILFETPQRKPRIHLTFRLNDSRTSLFETDKLNDDNDEAERLQQERREYLERRRKELIDKLQEESTSNKISNTKEKPKKSDGIKKKPNNTNKKSVSSEQDDK